MSTNSPLTIDNTKEDVENALCRQSCTVTFDQGGGYSVSVTATAGGPFTSCERAYEKACAKAIKAFEDAYE